MNKIGSKLLKQAEKALTRPDLNIYGTKAIRAAIKSNDVSKLRDLLGSLIRKGI